MTDVMLNNDGTYQWEIPVKAVEIQSEESSNQRLPNQTMYNEIRGMNMKIEPAIEPHEMAMEEEMENQAVSVVPNKLDEMIDDLDEDRGYVSIGNKIETEKIKKFRQKKVE